MEWDSTWILGLVAIGFLGLLLAGKILTVMELRAQEQVYRKNLFRISEIESDLETSRRKYLIALKAEGVAKNRVSKLRMREASLKQHMDQIALTEAQEEARKNREKEQALELAVLQAMGGPAHRDSHFLRVMKVIKQVIDLEAKNSNEEIMKAVQTALVEVAEMDKGDDGKGKGDDGPQTTDDG